MLLLNTAGLGEEIVICQLYCLHPKAQIVYLSSKTVPLQKWVQNKHRVPPFMLKFGNGKYKNKSAAVN